VRQPLLGLDRSGDFVRVPIEALVVVLRKTTPSFTEIEWNQSILRVFTVDLAERTDLTVRDGRPTCDARQLKRASLADD
jgi:hypothetical protein